MNFSRNNIFSNIPTITKFLLIANLALFAISYILPDNISNLLAIYSPQSPQFRPFQIITHMFMHGNFTHLFFNMFALFMFGSVLERYWGSQRFFIYYFVTGFGAVAIHLFIQYLRIKHAIAEVEFSLGHTAVQEVINNGYKALQMGYNYNEPLKANLNLLLNTQTVGASGAVYGLLLAFAINFPNTPLYFMFIPIPIKAKWMVLGFFFIELGLGILNHSGDNVAHFAHLGGMLFGLILIFLWKKRQFKQW